MNGNVVPSRECKPVRFLFCCCDCISFVRYVMHADKSQTARLQDELTVTLAAISLLLLIACVGASPVAIDGAFGHLALEALAEVVEDCELVLAEQVGVRVGVEVVGDLGDGILQVRGDIGVEIALGIASNIDGSLVGQLANAVDADCVDVVGAAAHCRRGEGDGVAEVDGFG